MGFFGTRNKNTGESAPLVKKWSSGSAHPGYWEYCDAAKVGERPWTQIHNRPPLLRGACIDVPVLIASNFLRT